MRRVKLALLAVVVVCLGGVAAVKWSEGGPTPETRRAVRPFAVSGAETVADTEVMAD